MNSNKIKQQEQRCRTEWFKNHRARLFCDTAGDPIHNAIIIDWSNPESWNYGCRFIIHRLWVCVVGDIGEAVYKWGSDLTLEFLAKIDFDYFYGKCQASEDGRRFTLWDASEAIESIRYYITPEDPEVTTLCKWQETLKEILEQVDNRTQKYDFDELLHRAYDDGVDGEVLSAIKSAGEQPHPRAIGHFVGLQMAISQLNENKTAKEATGSNA